MPGITVLDLINFLVVLILSTALHEATHAWLADRFGDDTPRAHGRLTLNPFPHLDLVMSVIVPAAIYWFTNGQGFLTAASTPVDPWKMRNTRWHPLWTALGGPAANLALGTAAVLVLGAAGALGFEDAKRLASLFVTVNVFMGVFNLLPLPPLDGANVIHAMLPARLQPRFWELRRYAMPFFIVLLFTGALDRTIFPVMNAAGELAGRSAGAIARGLGG